MGTPGGSGRADAAREAAPRAPAGGLSSLREERRRRLIDRLEALLVFLATLILYTGVPGVWDGVGSHPFLNWDDDFYIVDNPMIRALTWENARRWFTEPYFGNYAPLHLLSYALNVSFRGGLRPGDFHLTDATLHAGSAVAAFFLLRRLVGPGLPALLGALLFAFHPSQVESVAWASERKSTLAMAFLLPSLLLYLRHRDRTPEGVRSGWPTGAYLASLVLYLLSLLTKSLGVVLPVLLVLHEVLADPRPRRTGRYAELAPWFLLALAAGFATLWAQQGAGALHSDEPRGPILLTMPGVFAEYARTLFLPTELNNAYYPEMLQSAARSGFLIPSAFLAALAAATGWALRRAPRAAFWSLWFFVSLGPVSNVLPLTILRADRWLYLPSLALGGLAGLLLGRFPATARARHRIAAAALAAVAAFFALLSHQRIGLWGDPERLWLDSVRKAPHSHIARGSLGDVYFQRGESARSLAEYREAVRLQPRYEKGFFNIGFIEVRTGDMKAAAEAFRRGLAAAPEPPPWNPGTRHTYGFVHFYIGVEDFAEGRYKEAEVRYRRALEYQPDFPEALFNLGLSLERLERGREACMAFDRAAGLRPSFYEAHREAALCGLRTGAPREEALRHLRAALSLRPDAPEAGRLRALLDAPEAGKGRAGPR